VKPLSFSGARTPSDMAGDVMEVNVTPVMNMFIILIPFLVSVAVFTHLTVLEMSLPPGIGAGSGGADEKPKLKVTVVLHENFLAITYGEKMLDSIPRAGAGYDLALFSEKLKAAAEKADIRDEIVVAVRDAVKFKHVVSVMDRCREGGFIAIGLSSAAAEETAR
jgi:biopolymer transport protein ExbD